MINNEKEAAKKLKVILEGRKDKRGKTDTDEALEIAIKALEQANTGEWLMTDATNWYDAYFECSCCGREICIPYDLRNQVINKYPYCHCGAKMKVLE